MTTFATHTTSTVHVAPHFTPQDLRATMGTFASGVVVVTAFDEDQHDAEPLGFTCQSFTSLSLDPPLISINPARSSRTWPCIRAVGRFAVNILAHDQAHLSNGFAKSGADKYAGVSWHFGPAGSPILDGASAWIECSIRKEYDGGDHTIVVGEVTAMSHDVDRDPLLYYRGSYPKASW